MDNKVLMGGGGGEVKGKEKKTSGEIQDTSSQASYRYILIQVFLGAATCFTSKRTAHTQVAQWHVC